MARAVGFDIASRKGARDIRALITNYELGITN
ncbi:hypothetical protein NIES21_42620 [Anabaenopsis circularis NIES-21]|uniref:Uncharacterized protein n=1 Tax=Anabaenopsis circularis NIES-21 TaxID=1085406 RepID=A0A1Z4GLN0_9CYAN|nr:hypothetical protein NIES21_42620 [Anabaenopsis circularis NIES-21]